MRFSLQRIARSSRLLSIAMLAWLLLVMQTATAAPLDAMRMGTMRMNAPAMPAANPSASAMVMTAASHAGSTGKITTAPVTDACCDDHADAGMPHNICHCAAMSGNLLLPPGVSLPGSVAIAASYARLATFVMPATPPAPPLRPPAA